MSKITARVGKDGDQCDECSQRIAPGAEVILYASEPGAPAKMLCGTACLVKLTTPAAA